MASPTTMLFDRIVKKGDTVRHPFAGNASGETWNSKVYEVGTGAGGTDTEITSGVSVASAVAGTALYQLTITSGGLTEGKLYYAFVTRPADGAVVRFSSWAYAPSNDIGQEDDTSSAASVFGRIKRLDGAIGVSGFSGGGTTLYAMLTDATNGLSAIKTAIASVSTDLNADVSSAFSGVAGVTDVSSALRKIYDSGTNSWTTDISAYNTSGQAGTYLKSVATSVGTGSDAASADYSNGSVHAKLRKLGEYVGNRLPSSGYAGSTTDVAGGQAAIYDRIGSPAGASIAGDIASVYNRLGSPAGASIAADVAAVKSETALIKAKTDLVGTASDTSSEATVFGKIAGVKGETASIKTTGETVNTNIGTSVDTTSAATVFGKIAGVQAVVDRLNKIANALLLPIVPTEVAAPAASVTDGIAIKFELKVTDPASGALEDPDTFTDSGTQYKAHVRVTDLSNQHWGARLYSDSGLTAALTTSAGGGNEPSYSGTPLGGGASSEAFRRVARESTGQFAGYVKVLPTDNATLSFVFQIVDSDPSGTAKTFTSWSTMVVRSPSVSFPMPGSF